MPKATWNGTTIAESEDTVVVDGNHYFPRETVRTEYLQDSVTKTHCPWKGEAEYYSLTVDGDTNADAAWCYPAPKEAAANIKDHIAFWRGVEVTE